MFNFICGQVVAISDGKAVIENNGIGYDLTVSNYTLSQLSIGEKAQLYTYLQVREDALALFGFSSTEEKNMFLQLTTVSGIGAKVAMSILSGMQINDLGIAILNGDTSTLTTIKGLGKKTAERIILELREKMTAFNGKKSKAVAVIPLTSHMEEAVSVLRALGLSVNDASERAKKAYDKGAVTTEEILNYSLKNF